MGACLLCCPPALPLVGFYAPIPPTPIPAGRGSPKVYYAADFPPPPPPPRPGGGGAPFIFFRRGPPPPPPRRRAAYGTYRDSRTSALRRETCGSPQERRQTVAHSFAGAARVQPRGCKGRSPLHKITLSLPLPAGKGVGGMGAEKQAKGRAGGRQTRQAPLADTTVARSAGNQPDKPPPGA